MRRRLCSRVWAPADPIFAVGCAYQRRAIVGPHPCDSLGEGLGEGPRASRCRTCTLCWVTRSFTAHRRISLQGIVHPGKHYVPHDGIEKACAGFKRRKIGDGMANGGVLRLSMQSCDHAWVWHSHRPPQASLPRRYSNMPVILATEAGSGVDASGAVEARPAMIDSADVSAADQLLQDADFPDSYVYMQHP